MHEIYNYNAFDLSDYDSYHPFGVSDITKSNNMHNNSLGRINNSNLSYEVLNINNVRYILTNNAIFDGQLYDNLIDICAEIKYETVNGNSITNLRIDP